MGIGTTSPTAKLHVTGNAGSLTLEGVNHNYIAFYPDSYSSGRKAWVGFGDANDDNFTIQNQPSAGNIILTAAAGNVGIGTASPSARLDVAGDLSLSSAGDSTITMAYGGLSRIKSSCPCLSRFIDFFSAPCLSMFSCNGRLSARLFSPTICFATAGAMMSLAMLIHA